VKKKKAAGAACEQKFLKTTKGRLDCLTGAKVGWESPAVPDWVGNFFLKEEIVMLIKVVYLRRERSVRAYANFVLSVS